METWWKGSRWSNEDWHLGFWLHTSVTKPAETKKQLSQVVRTHENSHKCAETVYELPNLIKGPASLHDKKVKHIKTVFYEQNRQDTSWLSRGSKHSQLERGIETLDQRIDRNDAEMTWYKHSPRICNKESPEKNTQTRNRCYVEPSALFLQESSLPRGLAPPSSIWFLKYISEE